jgi:hypothetical protein
LFDFLQSGIFGLVNPSSKLQKIQSQSRLGWLYNFPIYQSEWWIKTEFLGTFGLCRLKKSNAEKALILPTRVNNDRFEEMIEINNLNE